MWGAPDGNGNYTGLLGDLYNDWCDVGWANIWDRESHRATADLTYPHVFDSSCFLLRKPSELPKFMILIRPFSLEVWLALITCVMASLITLAFYGILVENSSASDLVYNL